MKPGSICWQDLTVKNAEEIRDFYEKVVGWEGKPERMGDYDDYNMMSPHSESPVAGICHAKGGEKMLYWALIFLIVAIVAGIFGFIGIAGVAMELAKILFFVFLVLFIIALIFGRRTPST